jgi:hypothetical protein
MAELSDHPEAPSAPMIDASVRELETRSGYLMRYVPASDNDVACYCWPTAFVSDVLCHSDLRHWQALAWGA